MVGVAVACICTTDTEFFLEGGNFVGGKTMKFVPSKWLHSMRTFQATLLSIGFLQSLCYEFFASLEKQKKKHI